MCELFGLSGKKHRTVHEELKEFFSHADENPNGWGIAVLDTANGFLKKEDRRADRSDTVKSLIASPLSTSAMIAHIRLATIGYDEMANTHPFTSVDVSYRTWTLAHNGTIFESGPLSPYFYVQDGCTDSERILLYITDCINKETQRKGRALMPDERFKVLDDIVTRISPHNKLNLLIYDGEMMYVHTNYRNSLYKRSIEGGYSFSTRPLSIGEWEKVEFTQLLAYKDGELLFTGCVHGNEYIPDKCSIDALYLAYSGL